jgi:hypothetical protein
MQRKVDDLNNGGSPSSAPLIFTILMGLFGAGSGGFAVVVNDQLEISVKTIEKKEQEMQTAVDSYSKALAKVAAEVCDK